MTAVSSPLEIAIDVRRGDHAPHTGIGRYVSSLTEALVARDDLRVHRLPSSPAALTRPLRKLAYEQLRLPLAARRHDVLHAPYYEVSPLAGRRLVLNVHDCDTLDAPEGYNRRTRIYRNEILRVLVRRAARIIVPSQATADRLVHHFDVGDRVAIVPYGVADVFFDATRPPGREPYVLYTGGPAARKDVPTMLAVVGDLFAAGYPGRLVLTGDSWSRELPEDLPSGVRERLELPGRIDDVQLAALYAGADLLLYPSRMEGFGFPVVEAMAAGCPVVSTTAGSIPELAGDVCALAEPGDRAGLLAACEHELSDSAGRAARVAAGRERARRYRWPHVAEATAAVYRSAVGG